MFNTHYQAHSGICEWIFHLNRLRQCLLHKWVTLLVCQLRMMLLLHIWNDKGVANLENFT